jgi:uncharacterized protein DUF4389
MASQAAYALRVEADLEPGLSRWLWLVKWFLALPHFIVLWFLWVAYGVLTVVAFFVILVTGRYPRSIFEFNVGVLRWSWRVADYAFGVLATDRYPPFTLAEVPGYPAHLEVAYPERLSRGLVLIKWWLLAIPHYLIVGILAGGGSWVAWNLGRTDWSPGTGLIGLLVLIAALILAFTGQYPRGLFDLILGLNRWVLRVLAYVGLMTDQYPPFRLDTGGREPAGTLSIPPGPPAPAPPAPTGTGYAPVPPAAGGGGGRPGWSAGRIVAVVAGALLTMVAIGSLGGGGFGLWADQTQRDAAGFLTTSARQLTTATYALSTDRIHLGGGPGSLDVRRIVGTVRIRVTSAAATGPVFVGIAPADQAAAYLGGVAHTVVRDVGGTQRIVSYLTSQGAAPPTRPTAQRFWAASSVGSGSQTITWPARPGSWTLLAMNADGTRGLDLRADVGATVPWLLRAAIGLLVVGTVLLVAGVLLIVLPVIGAAKTPRRQAASP